MYLRVSILELLVASMDATRLNNRTNGFIGSYQQIES